MGKGQNDKIQRSQENVIWDLFLLGAYPFFSLPKPYGIKIHAFLHPCAHLGTLSQSLISNTLEDIRLYLPEGRRGKSIGVGEYSCCNVAYIPLVKI